MPSEDVLLAGEVQAVAHLTGAFTLRSGRTSTEYFDKYRFEAQPDLLRRIADAMTPLIPPDTEVLAGLELGGVPVATALSLATGLPTAFVRKEAKAYGTAQLAEGAQVSGRRVLVVEDVVTSGGQVVTSAGDLRALGADVTDVLCVIDRESGAVEAFGDVGLRMHALFRASDLAATGTD